MIKLLYFAVFLALATASPASRLNGKIVGGKDIDITFVPHQVSLYTRGRFLCGGSIISENYVLTAGHCAVYSDFTIRAGSNYIYKNGSEHTVTQVVRHSNFGTNAFNILQNDIALMKVDPPFELDETRQIIPLVRQGKTFSAGLHGLVSGWGRLSEGGPSPEKLQGVVVPLISMETCQEQYSNYGTIPKGQICAAFPQGGRDACQGDSGGPFVVGGYLAGVVSWGAGCARPAKPGVYTEVAYFRDWIKEHSGI